MHIYLRVYHQEKQMLQYNFKPIVNKTLRGATFIKKNDNIYMNK